MNTNKTVSDILKDVWTEAYEHYDSSKCLKKQNYMFYMTLNGICLKECHYCPFEYSGCTVCGGAIEIVEGLCYHCNLCGLWDDAHNDEWAK